MSDEESLGNNHVDARTDKPNGAEQTKHRQVARATKPKNLEQDLKTHDRARILEEHASVLAEEDDAHGAKRAADRDDAKSLEHDGTGCWLTIEFTRARRLAQPAVARRCGTKG